MTEPASRRVTVRRHSERGVYDAETIHAILDEGLIGHLGVVVDGAPHVIPMMYARDGDRVYVHGAIANQALQALAHGSPAMLVVTLLDGLVLARSAFDHSMNYRAVAVLGQATEVTDPERKLAAMRALVEHVAAGRWEDTRQPNDRELKTTRIFELRLDEASAKVRTGPPLDEPDDIDSPHWAGVIPLELTSSEPVPAPDLARPLPAPKYARDYRRRG